MSSIDEQTTKYLNKITVKEDEDFTELKRLIKKGNNLVKVIYNNFKLYDKLPLQKDIRFKKLKVIEDRIRELKNVEDITDGIIAEYYKLYDENPYLINEPFNKIMKAYEKISGYAKWFKTYIDSAIEYFDESWDKPHDYIYDNMPKRRITSKKITSNTKSTTGSIEKDLKDFMKIRKLIINQLDKETKLKTIKAKINAIEKAIEHLVELKNISTQILSEIKKVGGYNDTKQSVITNLKDLEEQVFTKYDELSNIAHTTPTRKTKPKSMLSTNEEQRKRGIR
jgi:hypothetical protein